MLLLPHNSGCSRKDMQSAFCLTSQILKDITAEMITSLLPGFIMSWLHPLLCCDIKLPLLTEKHFTVTLKIRSYWSNIYVCYLKQYIIPLSNLKWKAKISLVIRCLELCQLSVCYPDYCSYIRHVRWTCVVLYSLKRNKNQFTSYQFHISYQS